MRTWLLILALGLLPAAALAQDINAGFVRGLWYSDDTFFADETVRIYVAIRNNTNADLTGTVVFYANDKRLGSQSVAALNGRIIESWIDWTPAYGNYELRAELNRVKLSAAGDETETVDSTLTAATDTRFVDYDTDGDGIGNETDLDDDADGVPDLEEIAAGTDPLVAQLPSETALEETSLAEREAVTMTNEGTSPTTAGLEQFLTPSRADTLLTNITAWTDRTKARLDDYRETRQAATDLSDTPEITVNSDGFGEVVRSTDTAAAHTQPPNQGNGIVADLVRFVGNILSALYAGGLALTSWLLGHAMLMQLLLLFIILGGTYFAARTLGSRPSGKR